MTTDTPTPGRNSTWFIPILIGIISVCGICLILGWAWLPGQKAQVIPTRTFTPFQYLFLGTETLTLTPRPETATPTETLPARTPTSGANRALTPSSTGEAGIFIIEDTPTVTITADPIFAGAEPMTAGKHDSIESEFTRTGSWNIQNNEGAYQHSFLVSTTIGSSIAFSFIGDQIILGYQTTDEAADMLVNIDGTELSFAQEVDYEWYSWDLSFGTHYVIVTHESGPTVNLDYIEIP